MNSNSCELFYFRNTFENNIINLNLSFQSRTENLKEFDLTKNNFSLDKNYLIRDINGHKDVVIKISFEDDKTNILIQE